MATSYASAAREGGGEALAVGMQAWKLSSEITSFGADPVLEWGRQNRYTALARVVCRTGGVADPEHVCKLFVRKPGDPKHGRTQSTPGPVEEGKIPKLGMYVFGKSDGGIVSMKQANKGNQPRSAGQKPAESVERRPTAKGNSGQTTTSGTPSPKVVSSGLTRVREAAKRDSKFQFNNLLHHVNTELLRKSYWQLKRHAAAGVDEVTWQEYGTGLQERLVDLHGRIHSGRYRARPSKRAWVTKSEKEQRPIGIASLEDKILQQALVTVLQQIYEVDFMDFSYGFRPGRSQHNALDAVFVAITQRKVNWVLEVDIRKFYDSLNHEWIMKFVGCRITDRRVLRLIRKFLRAGVLEDGEWSKTEVGTPQGAVISPLLANIYLHYVLDRWVQWWRSRGGRGEIYIVRYADDFVICFQYKSEAVRFQAELKQRLAEHSLEMHEGKTRLVEFGRFAERDRAARGEGKPETIDFLGFTHSCAKTRKAGKFKLLRRTIAKRLRKKVKEVKEWLKRRMHWPMSEQGARLKAVMLGHYNYYGVPGNREMMDAFRTQIIRVWMKILRRRSQKARKLKWDQVTELMATWIPSVRITHPYPDQRLCVRPKAGAV